MVWMLLLPGHPSASASECDNWMAEAVSVQGTAQMKKDGGTTWQNISAGDRFCAGDMIRILEDSRAAIVLQNEAVIRLDEKTTITLQPEPETTSTLLRIIRGAAHFFSRIPRSLQVATPFVNGSVEGTEFFVRVDDRQTYFSVFKGRVRTFNEAGELLLAAGDTAVATQGGRPELKMVIHPRDAVAWTLYYPKISGSDTRTAEALEQAGTYLDVGRVDKANVILDRLLAEDPTNGDALAYKTVVELARNRKAAAKTLSEKALAADPQSVTVKMAVAYVLQADFEIEKARDTLIAAAVDDPGNAPLHARISELWLASGHLDKASAAAGKAAALSADQSRPHTIMGFAHLSRSDIDAAVVAFERGASLDPADPLPRLGLGIAWIRSGDLKAGRGQIEIAASLDPGNSLVRSYLGKAFYEERQTRLAGRQYEVAKELDPNDPTPYFYDALLKQSENRPVEALHQLLQSIALNDNRAVYRSRLLLDEDLAARSAGLGEIYADLGFQQLAMVQGWKSINTDPSNYSAHRLLSNVYAARPRNEIGRVSEMLQSMLLQPLNTAPIQPRLAETDLLITDGLGPASPSLNEYNALFLRNQFRLQASGIAGSNDTFGDEISHSGLWNRFSYSLGQLHYETDGFRSNNELNEDLYTAFAQVTPTPWISVQGEYRRQEVEHGDLAFNFDLETFDDTLEKEKASDTMRLGLHLQPSPASNLIASVIHQNTTNKEESIFIGLFPYELTLDTTGYLSEIQYLYKHGYWNLTLGAGHYNVESTIRSTFSEEAEFDTTHDNGYAYLNFSYPKAFDWTLGVSANALDDSPIGDTDKVNPKFGLTADLIPGTTLRLAGFTVLTRDLVNDQTIEPTQIAGFNQFYDDFNGTESAQVGVALDQMFTANVHGGVEYFRRMLEVPTIGLTGTITEDWEEDAYRAYLYLTPSREIAISAEYQFEVFDRDVKDEFGITPIGMKTHLLPVAFKYYHPSGFFGNCGATYVNQVVEPAGGGDDLEDDFTLVDVGVGYRLPNRRGVFSIGVKNLFDREFDYMGLDTRTSQDPNNPPFLPERTFFARISLAF